MSSPPDLMQSQDNVKLWDSNKNNFAAFRKILKVYNFLKVPARLLESI